MRRTLTNHYKKEEEDTPTRNILIPIYVPEDTKEDTTNEIPRSYSEEEFIDNLYSKIEKDKREIERLKNTGVYTTVIAISISTLLGKIQEHTTILKNLKKNLK